MSLTQHIVDTRQRIILRLITLLSSRKSETQRTRQSFLGMIKVGAAHSEALQRSRTPMRQRCSSSFLNASKLALVPSTDVDERGEHWRLAQDAPYDADRNAIPHRKDEKTCAVQQRDHRVAPMRDASVVQRHQQDQPPNTWRRGSTKWVQCHLHRPLMFQNKAC